MPLDNEIVYNIVTYDKNRKYLSRPMVSNFEDLEASKIEALVYNLSSRGEEMEFISIEGSKNVGISNNDLLKLMNSSPYFIIVD
tara:strand:- start:12409 stop:12660 length:252 start_codon:yes stop_codon:yes gene_type:complete